MSAKTSSKDGSVAKSTDRKTQPTAASVDEYLASVEDSSRKADAEVVTELMRSVTKCEPQMWGPSIIGFGRMLYKTADGVEREHLAVGLSARKAALSLYGLTYYESNADLLEKLGKHTTGKGCLYIKRLSDVDLSILEELIVKGWETNHVNQ